jgi:hypothetical protein
MEQREAPGRSNDGRNSPIFVPAVKPQGKLVRRGARQRRRMLLAGVSLVVLLVAAFTYAFVVERDREETVKQQSQ